jgi:4-hydroxy-tetrahydrodipicolinate synthase
MGPVSGSFARALAHLTVGIIGAGRVGQRISQRARTFGMLVIDTRRRASEVDEFDPQRRQSRPRAIEPRRNTEIVMNNGKVDWHGSYVAVVTPFLESEEIDESAFRENIEFLVEQGADGIVVSGCTGESWSLSPDERLRLFRLAVETTAGRTPVIAGTGSVSTQTVIDLSVEARTAGVAGVMVLPPYYCMAGRREIMEHYRAISDQVKHPILLYNIPRRTGFNLTPEFLVDLVKVEWIAGIKESSNDFIQTESTIQAVGDQIQVFTGHSAERAVPALLMGAKGYVSSMESQIMGREAIEMYDLVEAGRLDEARTVQHRTLVLDQRMREAGTFPANLKAGMNVLGRRGGVPRRPLLPLTVAETGKVKAVLAHLNIASVAV